MTIKILNKLCVAVKWNAQVPETLNLINSALITDRYLLLA